MTLISRAASGLAPAARPYTTVRHGGRGTIHYSASAITPGGRKSPRSKPEKPGPKWYRLWRNKATPAIQRRRISKQIAAYNRAIAEWKRAGGVVPPAIVEMEKRIWRSFQELHTSAPRNWADIAYHRGIFASGNVYEGRPLGTQGSHAVGANDTVGYCLVAGPGDVPTPSMLAALRGQMKDDGVTSIKGHRQRPGNATACPGDEISRALGL